MKKIELDSLDLLEQSYKERKENTITRYALAKNPISSLVYNQEAKRHLDYDFNLTLKTLPVANQMQSGRCWIFAGCNIIREKVASKYHLDNFELSQSFVAFYDKLERANYYMESLMSLPEKNKDDRLFYHIMSTGVEDGGQWDMFVNVIRKYGVVPKDVFPETYQSSNTSEMNRLINRKLKQFVAYLLEGKENICALKEETLKDIYTILLDCYGIPPKKFDFEYTDKEGKYHIVKDLTPKEFYTSCCEIDLENYISIIHAPTKDKPFHKTYTVEHLGNVVEGKNVLYLNLPMEDFQKTIIKQLENREAVWFGSDCNQFFERDEGLWAIELLKYGEVFGMDFEMTKEEMLDATESTMNHAMVLTGVHIEEDKPVRWKIENSWGDAKGEKGYYVGGDSWFQMYVFEAVVHKKYLTDAMKKVLEEEPIPLKPWDPMGTLARKNA